ncbi:MAG: hypothetical protein QOJ82_288 [Solirubrobacteraceae bacterium]|nr:hypothetical protein [Solirubrobacteraceae bacterium]
MDVALPGLDEGLDHILVVRDPCDAPIVLDPDKQLPAISVRECHESLANVLPNLFGIPRPLFEWWSDLGALELPKVTLAQIKSCADALLKR